MDLAEKFIKSPGFLCRCLGHGRAMRVHDEVPEKAIGKGEPHALSLPTHPLSHDFEETESDFESDSDNSDDDCQEEEEEEEGKKKNGGRNDHGEQESGIGDDKKKEEEEFVVGQEANEKKEERADSKDNRGAENWRTTPHTHRRKQQVGKEKRSKVNSRDSRDDSKSCVPRPPPTMNAGFAAPAFGITFLGTGHGSCSE